MCDNIKVAIRVRALIEREQRSGQSVNWFVKDNSIAQVEENGKIGKPYNFDKIFDQQMTTYDIFEDICKPIVDAAIEGFHGTVFAYGQSSSGKTFTMSGTKVQPGVVPLAINEIFYQIENASDREFLMRVSYLEIYNEKISDLLSDEDKIIKLHEDSDHNVQLVNVIEEVVNESAQVFDVIKKGDMKRHVAETKQNDRSSRSHCILRIIIESRSRHNPDEDAVMVSHLNFVDLAGSEKAADNTGLRFREGCAINKSLLTLGQVIHRLSGDESTTHVSYRDSKLTRILQNALGGNSKTAILCTMTPASIEESHSTLKFASRAKTIKNKPHLNEVLSDAAMLKKYQREISRLQSQISEMGNLHEMHMQKEDLEKKLQEKEEAEEKQKNLIEKLRQMVVISKTDIAAQEPVPRKKRRMTWCPGKKASIFGPSFAELQPLPEFSPPGRMSMFLEDESIRKSSAVMFRSSTMILEEDSPEKAELLSTTIGTNDTLKELFEFVFGSGIIELEEQMEKVIKERDLLKREVTTLKERLKVLEAREFELPSLSAGSTHDQEWLEKFRADHEKHGALVTELQQELNMCKMELELERNQKQCNTSITVMGSDEDNTAVISATIVPEVERDFQLLQDERDYYHSQVEELEEKLREASSVHGSNNETSMCDLMQASKLSETMAELSDAQSRQAELEEMLKESQTEMEDLKIALQTMKVSIERLASENEQLQEANKRLKTELKDSAERHVFENEQIEEANKRLKNEKISLQNRVDNLEEKVQLYSDTIHDVQEEKKISEKVSEELKTEVSRLNRSIEDAEQKYETRLSELKETYQRLMLEKEEENKTLERLIIDLKAETCRLEESRSVVEQKYEIRISELEITHQKFMSEKEEEHEIIMKLNTDLRAEISRLQEGRNIENTKQKYELRISELEETQQQLIAVTEELKESHRQESEELKESHRQESEDLHVKINTLEEELQTLRTRKGGNENVSSCQGDCQRLEAEAEKLREYETNLKALQVRLMEEEKKVEIYKETISEFREERSRAENVMQDMKSELQTLKEENESPQREMNVQDTSVTDLKRKSGQYMPDTNRVMELEMKCNSLQQTLLEAEERIAMYSEAMEEFKEEEKKLQEELVNLRYKKMQMREELAEHAGCKTKISNLESQCRELMQKVEELCKAKQDSQAPRADTDDEISHPHHDCQEVSLRQNLEETEKRVSMYIEAVNEFQDEQRKLQDELSYLRHTNSQLKEEIAEHSECQAKISSLESQCTQLNEKVNELCRTKQKSSSPDSASNDVIGYHDCEEESLRQKLQEAEQRVLVYTEAMTEYEEEEKKVHEELSDLRHKNSQLTEELIKYKMTLEEPNLHADCQFKISGLECQCQAMTERVTVYSEAIKEFQEEQKKVQEELSELNYRNSQLSEELADHKGCQAKIVSLESQCTQLKEKVNELCRTKQKSSSPDSASNDVIGHHDCEEESLRQKLQEAEQMLAAYKEAMTEFQEEERKVHEELSDLKHKNSQLGEELDKYKMMLEEPDLHADCQFKISGLESQCQAMTEQLEVYSETVHELKEENEMLERKITELKAKIFSFQDIEDLQEKYKTEISDLKETQEKLIAKSDEQKRHLLESAHLQERIKFLEEELEISKVKKQEVDDELSRYRKKCPGLETELEKIQECQKSLETLQLKVVEEERKVQLYSETIHELQKENRVSEKKITDLEEISELLKSKGVDMQQKYESQLSEWEETSRKFISEMEEEKKNHSMETENLQKRIRTLQEESDILGMKKREADEQIIRYQEKIQALESEAERWQEYETNLETLQLQLIEEEKKVEIYKETVTEFQEEKDQSEKVMEVVKSDLCRFKNHNKELQRTLEDYKTSVTELKKQCQQLEQDAAKASELEKEQENLQQALLEAEEKVSVYCEAITEFQEEQKKVQDELTDLRHKNSKLKEELAHHTECQAKISTLESQCRELNEKVSAYSRAMTEFQEEKKKRDEKLNDITYQNSQLIEEQRTAVNSDVHNECQSKLSSVEKQCKELIEENKKLKQDNLNIADRKVLADENLRLKKLYVQKENQLRDIDRQRNSGTASESYALTSARDELEALKKKYSVLVKDLKEMKELKEKAEISPIGPLPELSQGSNIDWESNWQAFCRAEASKRSVLLSNISDLKEELRKAKYLQELARELASEYEEREKNSAIVKELQAEVEKNWQQLSAEEEKNITLTKQLLEEQNRIRTLEEKIKQMEQKPSKNPEHSENVKQLEDKVRQLEDKVREYRMKCFNLDRNLQKAEERLSEYKESADVYEERISRMKKEMRRLANADASFIGYDPRSQSQEPITPQMTSATSQSLMMGSTAKDKTPATVGQAAMIDSGSGQGEIAYLSNNGSSSQSGTAGISSGSSSRGGIVEHFHMCLLEGKKKELEKEVKSLKSKIQKLEQEKNEARKPADTESNKKLQELEQENVGLKSQLTNQRAEIQKLKEDLKSASSLCSNCSTIAGSSSVKKHPLEA
ncbi:hypothetical protein ACJMK2_042146 [Sinanodonta woodiana]|uniref:Kinesin motor domain-containing protein n=1 Tax=Sinanodonta woodiana TaxID=1069815 RepID=A0ABD3W9F8_SINWO